MTEPATEQQPTKLDSWCIAELMGHKRIAGRITEVMVAGVGWLRIDIPAAAGAGWKASDLISPKAFFRIRTCTEEQARAAAAALGDAPPVADYELRALPSSSDDGADRDRDDEHDDDGSEF